MTNNDNNDNDNEGIASLIARLRKEESNCASVYIIDAAIDTIERLVNERDAARREVCEMTPRYEGRHDDTFEESRGVAVERGWDCFKNQETK